MSCAKIISKTKLNSKWVLWFHSPDEKSWEIDSYKNIAEFDTIEDFWQLQNKITPTHIQYGMFFIVRENIMPIWEDKNNIEGGCWSFKLPKKDIYKAWTELAVALIGESIYKNKQNIMNINGISISPKKSFSILKIWNKNKNENNLILLNENIPNLDINSCIYKPHISDETYTENQEE